MTVSNTEFPDPGELADDLDQDGWDRARDGKMSEFATDDDVVETDDYDETLDPEYEEVLVVSIDDLDGEAY